MNKLFLGLTLSFFCLSTLVSCAQKRINTKEDEAASTQGTELVPVRLDTLSKATFASGCFWCVEAAFESVKGVKEVVSGYAGGKEENPTYEEVGSGATGHAEAIEVYYDANQINYATLLEVYFASQDPTQINGQGPDNGRQYRSIIFYANDLEKQQAIAAKAKTQTKFDKPVAAEIVSLTRFWVAEKYHQNFVKLNPKQGYVLGESIPRIKRFQAARPDLIKEGAMF